MTTIDGRIYIDGHRTATPDTLSDIAGELQAPNAVAWIGLGDTDPRVLDDAADLFGLHPLAVEDARKGHQRAKLERYRDTMFVVLRPGAYDDAAETITFGEIHLFVGRSFVITLRRGTRPDLSAMRAALEAEPHYLGTGPEAMLTALMDEIVDGYSPITAGLEEDIDQVESSLFAGRRPDPALAERIYLLIEQVLGFQRAIGPLPDMIDRLLRGADRYGTDEETRNRLRNVLDHVTRITDRVTTCRVLLENALTVHSTLASLEQNDAMRRMSSASLAQGEDSRRLAHETMAQGEEVKKISSWAAILFTPTLIASIYGMNFDVIPELHWPLGYPFALLLMLGLGVGLWGIFKHKHWL
ncbi:transporter [Clavibacter michiganensis]|uniref:magnesium and cobalt transport protein CorA n=1 Tax=Clavibacter michiganensis TaxID=28447 RepID=UPI000CE80066|nr:magnesium and cobalt transport protein CorA [Clavibacter michiganensis]PPF50028.1 transporter [Clavibacter michiganensis]